VVNAARDGRGLGSLGDWSVGPKVSDSGVVACERGDRRVGSVSRMRARNEESGRPALFLEWAKLGTTSPTGIPFLFLLFFSLSNLDFSFPF
jgi:hypothetical protein